ncbi:MAG: hypothetical protein FH752_08970 [Marinobacter adhaerens]|uniref:Uncharacterized protein n=1 Tax=Marinobacter adhaerens TaxID=1033846 RepID=A0A844HUX5_9GAMM|nr:hypothetical protein [Marinobacter adhaerens]
MKLNPKTVREVQELSRATKEHFNLLSEEVFVYLDDFSDRVRAAEAGDETAGKKLLQYLRSCLNSRRLPDPLVADWAAQCIFEITQYGIDPNKAFSLKPETGRPSIGENSLRDLLTWEDVERIRLEQGLRKIDAIALYQQRRQTLAEAVEQLSEKGQFEEISTLEKMYRRGAKLVKLCMEETGK